jgi:hypothetical protein
MVAIRKKQASDRSIADESNHRRLIELCFLERSKYTQGHGSNPTQTQAVKQGPMVQQVMSRQEYLMDRNSAFKPES